MKVISIKEPYATLIACGYKKYEFRTWKTSFRGEVYIHASKEIDKKACERFKDFNLEYRPRYILAKGNIVDCIEVDDSFRNMLKEMNVPKEVYKNQINSNEHIYAFELQNVEQVKPEFVKGKLGIWNL